VTNGTDASQEHVYLKLRGFGPQPPGPIGQIALMLLVVVKE